VAYFFFDAPFSLSDLFEIWACNLFVFSVILAGVPSSRSTIPGKRPLSLIGANSRSNHFVLFITFESGNWI
jgi:hypothetical protein